MVLASWAPSTPGAPGAIGTRVLPDDRQAAGAEHPGAPVVASVALLSDAERSQLRKGRLRE